MYKKLEKCLKSIREKTDFKPEKAVILGSGLGDYAEKIKIEKIVKYTDIEDFPVSTVQGHKGQFVFGYVEDVPVVLMQGRVHYYEGYPMQDVVLPTRLMGMMGAKKILLTNAAGGVNPSFRPGDFMLIKDHITTAVPSPLIGPNIEELGTRFPDMSEVYSKKLQDIIRKSAKDCGIPLQEGVYMQLTWTKLRDTGRNPHGQKLGRRCSRYEYRLRSHGSKTYGNGSVWNLLHYEYGGRCQQCETESRRSSGDSERRSERF